MHFVYILYSALTDKYYTGESINPEGRLFQHNTSFFRQSSTTTAKDWKVVLTICVNNRSEARVVERFIKSMKSKRFLNSMRNDVKYYENFKNLVLAKFSINILN